MGTTRYHGLCIDRDFLHGQLGHRPTPVIHCEQDLKIEIHIISSSSYTGILQPKDRSEGTGKVGGRIGIKSWADRNYNM